jgi:hypothetical protein
MQPCAKNKQATLSKPIGPDLAGNGECKRWTRLRKWKPGQGTSGKKTAWRQDSHWVKRIEARRDRDRSQVEKPKRHQALWPWNSDPPRNHRRAGKQRQRTTKHRKRNRDKEQQSTARETDQRTRWPGSTAGWRIRAGDRYAQRHLDWETKIDWQRANTVKNKTLQI